MSCTVNAGGQWVNDWWDNVYKMRVEKEQYKQIKQESLSKCDTKIKWYNDHHIKDPDSDYYKYKLDDWKKKCNVE
jgi:hypothetical protein